eukprot:5888375-Pleurochrysis_carterae.AAC.1
MVSFNGRRSRAVARSRTHRRALARDRLRIRGGSSSQISRSSGLSLKASKASAAWRFGLHDFCDFAY